MYRIEEIVICRDLGVCKILNITPACCSDLSYDVLPLDRPEETVSILFHQIARHAMSKEDALAFAAQIPSIPPLENADEESTTAALQSYDPTQWVQLIKSSGEHGSSMEPSLQNAKTAKHYLYHELSAALGEERAETILAKI